MLSLHVWGVLRHLLGGGVFWGHILGNTQCTLSSVSHFCERSVVYPLPLSWFVSPKCTCFVQDIKNILFQKVLVLPLLLSSDRMAIYHNTYRLVWCGGHTEAMLDWVKADVAVEFHTGSGCIGDSKCLLWWAICCTRGVLHSANCVQK